MEDQSCWSADEVNFTKRPDLSVTQDGFLKSDGTPVRYCDGCGKWKLLEEFPKKPVPGTPGRASLQFCYECHGIPKPQLKKSNKGTTFSTYGQYVKDRLSYKSKLETLRSEYQTESRRLKSELEVVRSEYERRKAEVLEEQKEHEFSYRDSLRKNL